MTEHLPVAESRNWRAYGIAALVSAGATAGAIWFISGTAQQAPVQEEGTKPRGGSTMARLPDREFKPPPPPATPPAPAAIIPASAPPVAPPPPPPPVAYTPTPQPLKPMKSMAVGDGDADPFKVAAATINGQPLPAAAGDTRAGASAANKWLMDAGSKGNDFVTTPFLPPISKCMIQAGQIIAATTLNEVNSDLPGDVVAQISMPVFDTPTGQNIVIPPLATLYGQYSDDIEYGQGRAQIAWRRILMPDGSSQNIGSMGATDAAGAAGVEGDVDRHTGKMAGAIGLSFLTSIIGQAGSIWGNSGGQTTIVGVGAQGAGQEAQSIAREIATRELNRRNTIRIPSGSEVGIMVTRDIALPIWVDGVRMPCPER